MTFPLLYTHVLGAAEFGGFLYLLYRERIEFLSNPALALPVFGLLLFVATEVGVGWLPPLVVHSAHTAAAASVAVGLAILLVQWTTTRPATAPLTHPAESPEWMTDLDENVLSLLEESDIVLTPALISYNLGYSRESVNRHLRKLENNSYVERVDRGKYRLTDAGREHVHWNPTTTSLPATSVFGRLGAWLGNRVRNVRNGRP